MPVVHIKMFGEFSLTYQGKKVNYLTLKSDKLIKLLVYFIEHYQHDIPTKDLYETMWNDEMIDNPVGALKNLVYRLRNNLKKTLDINDFIMTKRGYYYINPKYMLKVDTLEFEEKYKNKEYYYEQLISLYKDHFLIKAHLEPYIMYQRLHYQKMIEDVIESYYHVLLNRKDYSKALVLSQYALSLDELKEDYHYKYIYTLYLQKRYTLARKAYQDTVNKLYDSLSTRPSSRLEELYTYIEKEEHLEIDTIQNIQKELIQTSDEGALLCEYGAFRHLYELTTRTISRLGTVASLCLVTVESDLEEPDLKYIEKTMRFIKEDLINGLRAGDIITRYNSRQYLVLLPQCSYEGAQLALKRVLKRVHHNLYTKDIYISLEIRDVSPYKELS